MKGDAVMNCPIRNTETTELLLDYCAGKLPLGTTAELERHIESCVDCQAFTQAQQQVWTALDDWDMGPISGDFDRRLYARIAEDQKPSWWQWIAGKLDWRPALSIGAACAAVAVLLFINAPGNAPAPVRPTAPPPAYLENTRVDSIEPEQLERALDDLEMLKQLSSAGTQSL
jgi:hypothetical protein